MAKGEYSDDEGAVPSHIKKKRMLQRIHEWEKFEANCKLLRELDDGKVFEISELRNQKRTSLSAGNLNRCIQHEQKTMTKAKSVSNSYQL